MVVVLSSAIDCELHRLSKMFSRDPDKQFARFVLDLNTELDLSGS